MEQRGLMEPPERGSQVELGPMDRVGPRSANQQMIDSLDFQDVLEAFKNCAVSLVKTSWVERKLAQRQGLERGYWEVHLTPPGAASFIMDTFTKEERAEADKSVEAYRHDGPSIAWDWYEMTDTEEITMPYVMALVHEQVKRTGLAIRDTVELNQLIEHKMAPDPRTEGYGDVEVALPPGARGIVVSNWLGTPRGVKVSAARGEDIGLYLEPSQLSLVEDSPMRETMPGEILTWDDDAWITVPQLRLGEKGSK